MQLLKPLALDLCCGKGGWTRGLLAAGYDVIGFDIEAWPGYPGTRMVVGDVREFEFTKGSLPMRIAGQLVPQDKITLVTASPPCQEFSYRSFPFKRCRELAKNVPPDKTIWEACVRIAKEAEAPLVLENVRGAQPYMGKAVCHYGSFYLWGDVPPMLPVGNPQKGFQATDETRRAKRGPLNQSFKRMVGSEKYKTNFPGELERKVKFRDMPHSSHSSARKEWSAIAAMIPDELGLWIGKCFHPEGH